MDSHATTTTAVRGCKIRLMRGGAGPALLILHGGAGAGPWLPYMTALAESFDVIAPEHPGFGDSEMPDWFDNIHDLAYFYLDFLDTLDLEGVHLVGLSLGGWIAAEMAVRDTRRLASLTLAGAAGIHVKGVPQLDPFLMTEEQRIRAMFHDPKRADEIVKRALMPEFTDIAMKNQLATAKLVWHPRGYDPHLAKWLHRIDVPTLVLWGVGDRLLPPAYADAWQKLVPGAEAVVLPDCGHLPQIEKPADFVAALRNFIDRQRLAA